MSDPIVDHVSVPESATPAEAQIIASLAVVRVQLGQALGTTGDHEQRIRLLENRKHVTPAMLWAGLIGLATLAGVAATVVMAIEGAIHH